MASEQLAIPEVENHFMYQGLLAGLAIEQSLNGEG